MNACAENFKLHDKMANYDQSRQPAGAQDWGGVQIALDPYHRDKFAEGSPPTASLCRSSEAASLEGRSRPASLQAIILFVSQLTSSFLKPGC